MKYLEREEVVRVVRTRCRCERRHTPVAYAYIYNPNADQVYYLTLCVRCKRARLQEMGDLFAFRCALDDVVYTLQEFIYEQKSLLP